MTPVASLTRVRLWWTTHCAPSCKYQQSQRSRTSVCSVSSHIQVFIFCQKASFCWTVYSVATV